MDLNSAISNFEKLCYPIIGDGIELVSKLDAQVGRIRADAGQLDQVLMNLVVNARDAMPDGGTLTIQTANVERAACGVNQRGNMYAWRSPTLDAAWTPIPQPISSSHFSPPRKRAKELD